MLYALAILGGNAGAVRAAYNDGLLKKLGSGSADVCTGADDLAGFEGHGAAGVAYALYFANGLNIVAGVYGARNSTLSYAQNRPSSPS